MSDKQKQYRWGRSRFNGVPTMRLAIPVGVALAIGYGMVHVLVFNPDGPMKWVAGLILGACLAPCAVALVALLILDRSTLPGAVAKPEQSIEGAWYAKAAEWAFNSFIAILGVAAGVTSSLQLTTISLTLAAAWVVLVLCFGVAYLIQRIRS